MFYPGTVISCLKKGILQKFTHIKNWFVMLINIWSAMLRQWSVQTCRITAIEIKFIRMTAGYTHWDHKKKIK